MAIFRLSALVVHVLALSPSIGALSCYKCDTESSCQSPEQKTCDDDFDACVLKTTWKGDLYMETAVYRYCGFASECPRTSPDRTPFCNQTEDILTCTMCCQDEDYCNNGGEGKILRPPPYPPVPTPLVKRLAENVCTPEGEAPTCSTSMSWTEESSVVNVVAVCGEPATNDVPYTLTSSVDTCTNNNEDDTGLCVTCCSDGKCSGSTSTSQSAISLLVLACSLVRWLVTS